MRNNLPARIPVRAETETTPATASSASVVAPAETCTPIPRPAPEPQPAFTGLVLDRRALAFALRFASRLASRAPIQALKSCLFADGYLVATDLDVSLRARIPSTGYLGVLVVAADALKRCVFGSEKPDVEIVEIKVGDGPIGEIRVVPVHQRVAVRRRRARGARAIRPDDKFTRCAWCR